MLNTTNHQENASQNQYKVLPLSWLFAEVEKLIVEFTWNFQELSTGKTILKKRN